MTTTLQTFTNNAFSVLKTSINASDTTLQVVDASSFPTVTAGTYFKVTLDTGVTQEIVEVWARSGNTFSSLVRGSESTTARFYPAGTRVEVRATAATLNQVWYLKQQIEQLQANNFSNVGSITFSSTPDANALRRLAWNGTEKTLDLGIGFSGLPFHLGQQGFLTGRNNTGSILPAGTVVGVNGVDAPTGRVIISPISSASGVSYPLVLGVLPEAIPVASEGLVQLRGSISSINTTGTPYSETWTSGDILYVSPLVAGQLTKTQPVAPSGIWPVAIVTSASASGSIHVAVQPVLSLPNGSIAPVKLSTGAPVWDSSNNVGIGTSANPAVRLDVSGRIRLLSDASGGPVLNYSWINTTTSSYSYKIATLPATSSSTYDAIHILGVVDSGGSANTRSPIELIAGNRGGFAVRYLRGPALSYPSHIDVYTESDGTTSIWVVQDTSSSSIGLNILQAYGSVITYPNPTAGSPTGTLTFSTKTSTPSLLYDITTGNLTVTGNLVGNVTGNVTGSSGSVANGVYLSATQTLTNKTITGLLETKVSLAASNIDLSSGNYFSKTISTATTFTVSNVPASGTAASFLLDLTNGGSATVTWLTGTKWASGAAPTLTAAGRDMIAFHTYDGGSTWVGTVIGKDIK